MTRGSMQDGDWILVSSPDGICRSCITVLIFKPLQIAIALGSSYTLPNTSVISLNNPTPYQKNY